MLASHDIHLPLDVHLPRAAHLPRDLHLPGRRRRRRRLPKSLLAVGGLLLTVAAAYAVMDWWKARQRMAAQDRSSRDRSSQDRTSPSGKESSRDAGTTPGSTDRSDGSAAEHPVHAGAGPFKADVGGVADE